MLVLGKEPAEGLEHTFTAEKMYSINFTVTECFFCLSLHYSGANSYFKVKYSQIVATRLCLRNISKDQSVDNMKKLD